MRTLSIWPAVLGLALAMLLIMALQAAELINPVPHSLAYASVFVVLTGLIGWVLEARQVAGPPPAVEPEHEEEEEEAPGPSYWPVILALGIVGIAVGLVYSWEYLAVLVAVPLAAAAGYAWMNDIKNEVESGEPARFPWYVPPTPAQQAAAASTALSPVPTRTLATQAAGGAVIAIETAPTKQVSRRGLLRISFWAGLGTGLAAFAGTMVDMLYPRGVTGFGSVIQVPGTAAQYPPGSKKDIAEGKFWLVNLTEEQGGPGFLALWWKCPHLGCTVPWRETFAFVDPNTGAESRGWFRCPCHGSTYNHAGVRVFGPAPRSMDTMELTIDASSGRISVNTGAVRKGVPENASFAVRAP